MSVEKLSDELWIGAKDQSNSVIAGSLRKTVDRSERPIKLSDSWFSSKYLEG